MSRSEHSPSHHPITGAHRAVPRVPRRTTAGALPDHPPTQDEPYLDGLFTYCLSVLCEHEAAVAALGDTLALAERARGRLRDPRLRRAWLYALARWVCLRRLARRRPAPRPGPAEPEPDPSAGTASRYRAELAALAWPEAAGTTPEQREAIELAVRHQLTESEIAAVLGTDPDGARSLVSRAACEIERTRTALAVAELGRCPSVARIAGDTRVLLGNALRSDLVRHVDECPVCRNTAERADAAGPWPGTATPAVLGIVEAPRQAAYTAMLRSQRAIRAGVRDPRGGAPLVPHFDRRGFPLDDKERAARRALIRHRAVTTTVVAAVVAAPALTLWAAYRHAPHTGEGQEANPVSATESDGKDDFGRDRTGGAPATAPGHSAAAPSASPSRSASGTPSPSRASASPSARAGTPTQAGPGWITVAAQPQGDDTVITVTDEGGSPVRWTATTHASWLQLSETAGELGPGQSVTITVAVDHDSEPAGAWRGRIVFEPSGSAVTIEGQGATPTPTGTPTPTPTPTPTATPVPSAS
ncbi:sigma-70 family RNA polymerase sigma factor [Streptomyces sp. ICBB 8177]|uniref:BACON domain-containing protein n=1 Tax=Streptomyces sp. ICBB 8177 TaxID=563922 RepID=UPI001F5401D2|nr:sigma-70 family RNA polymerase sigma factor [Streptomyces sp. ICBB 8177]